MSIVKVFEYEIYSSIIINNILNLFKLVCHVLWFWSMHDFS